MEHLHPTSTRVGLALVFTDDLLMRLLCNNAIGTTFRLHNYNLFRVIRVQYMQNRDDILIEQFYIFQIFGPVTLCMMDEIMGSCNSPWVYRYEECSELINSEIPGV